MAETVRIMLLVALAQGCGRESPYNRGGLCGVQLGSPSDEVPAFCSSISIPDHLPSYVPGRFPGVAVQDCGGSVHNVKLYINFVGFDQPWGVEEQQFLSPATYYGGTVEQAVQAWNDWFFWQDTLLRYDQGPPMFGYGWKGAAFDSEPADRVISGVRHTEATVDLLWDESALTVTSRSRVPQHGQEPSFFRWELATAEGSPCFGEGGVAKEAMWLGNGGATL